MVKASLISMTTMTLTFTSLFAGSAPDTMWTRVYGGPGGDVAYSVTETSDGFYLVSGYTGFGAGMQDCWLLKLDRNGDTIWTKTFGGTAEDGAHRVIEARDGGYLIVGYTQSAGAGGKDVYIIKTDKNGSQKWVKTYGGILQDVAYGIIWTTGGYVLCGYRDGPSGWAKGDLWILAISESGDTLWTKTYGGPGEESCNSIRELEDGFIISGYTESSGAGGKDSWLIRTDADGDTLWTRTYGGTMEDVAYGVNITQDGHFIMTGYVDGTGEWTAGDFWMAEANESGETLWTRRFGSAGEDFGFDLYPTTDGGYVVGGERALDEGDLWIAKTDAEGDTLWTKNLGGNLTQSALSLFPTSDGGYIAAGMMGTISVPDLYVVKTRPAVELISPSGGDTLASGVSYAVRWRTENFPKPPHTFRLLFSDDAGGSFEDTVAAGLSPTDTGFVWTVPSEQGGLFRMRIELTDDSNKVVSEDESDGTFSIFPGVQEFICRGLIYTVTCQNHHPCISYSLPPGGRGTISLYDPSGRRIESVHVQGEGRATLSSDPCPGLYFICLQTGNARMVRKILVLR